MAWLAACDRYIEQRHPVVQFVYLVTKWTLAALGAFALLGVWADRIGLWSLY